MNDVCPAAFGGWYSASKAALASASAVLDAETHGFGISVTVVAPGLFRTAMSDKLVSYDIAGDSPYAAAFEGLREQTATRLETAGDPEEVAAAIEGCIRADDPPARIVVGADAADLEKMTHETSADDFARLSRAFVAGLAEQSDPPDAG
jgi:NAD(P)-dependent dehydrogenase (short-subunit alcohol dehydrogenase family)